MRRQTRPAAGLLLLLLLLSALALACRQEVPPLFRRNQPPETTLTIVPEDSAQGLYHYHVYWRGDDTDGRVVRFIFAITDTLSRNEEENWDPELFEDRDRSRYTDRTDSIFVFNAATGRQCFNISAIDDFGRVDDTPARAYFKVIATGEPKVVLLGVQGFRNGNYLPPCGTAAQCTIPTYTSFKVRFTGTTPNGRITGYQWQGVRPNETNPEPIQPLATDSLFWAAGHDTTFFVFGSQTDTLWSLRQDVVTVYYYNILADSTRRVPPGNFSFRARVRDEARRASVFKDGTYRIVVNFDPETALYRIPARDCPRCSQPNPPPYCSSQDSIAAGFISGFDQVALADTSTWERFCQGDTLTQRCHVRFYVRGSDDPRDVSKDPAGLRDVLFSSRFEKCARGEEGDLCDHIMPFSKDPRAVLGSYHLPDGTPWRGWVNGWGDTQRHQGLCPFDFTYFAAAVDENGKSDGTPDSLSFYVSGSPQLDLDSLRIPNVVVLAPTCSPAFLAFCPDLTNVSFGPDTLLVVGRHVPDTSLPPNQTTPLGMGWNRFALQFRVPGHDHPRDSRSEIRSELTGRIRAWRYFLTCTGSCEDLALPGEGQWRQDTYDPNVYDDTLQVTLVLDTLCTSTPCGFNFKAALPTAPLGAYRFDLRGRDTDAIGQTCLEPSDLGPISSDFSRPASDYGRLTQSFTRTVVIRQLQEVRPYVQRPNAYARSAPSSRKRWWQR